MTNDRGTTLIEVLLVTIVMALVATALAVSITIIIRTTDPTEARVNDARTLLGLTTYLPEDVNSTPPGAYDFDKTKVASCAGASSAGVSLVHMTWTENVSGLTTFEANYRYEPSGDGYEVVRYWCEDGGTALRRSMTSDLPSIDEATWSPGDAPVEVQPVGTSPDYTGLTVAITTIDGDVLELEMRSNNPAVTLPPVPPTGYPPVPPGNLAPTAAPVSSNTEVGVPRNVWMAGVDPDGDALVATVANVPAGWTTSIVGLTVTVTPDAGAPVGTIETFDYTVTDPYGQSASSTVTIEIVAVATNNPPVAANVVDVATAGTPLIINLPVSDPDGDPLAIGWSGEDPSLTVSVVGTVMTVTSTGATATPGPFTYTVDDGTAPPVAATVDISVIVCSVTDLSPATSSVARRNGNKRLENDVTYTVTYTGPCTDLVLGYDNDLDDGTYDEVFLSFGAGTTVTVAGHPGGLSPWSLGDHTMTLRDGFTGPPILTATLTVTS